MKYKSQENVTWIEFDLLADCSKLTHGSFLRDGGYSEGVYASLNLSSNVGDHPEHVQKNKNKVAKLLNCNQLVGLQQCHGIVLHHITQENLHHTLSGDALITTLPNIGLLINHADCQAAILYDPIQNVLALVHCGWRGNVQNIYSLTIKTMQERYKSKPENLLVAISPSLGPEDAQFINYRTELPEAFWDFKLKDYYFDLWEISRWQLEKCGVFSHHIEVAQVSTMSHSQCFSYRRDKTTGRLGTLAALTV